MLVTFLYLSVLCSPARQPGGPGEVSDVCIRATCLIHACRWERNQASPEKPPNAPLSQPWETSSSQGPHSQQIVVIFTKYFWKNECKVQEMQCKLLERSTSAT